MTRWRPKKKRQHEDKDISNWVASVGDTDNQITDVQINNPKAPPDNLGSRQLALNTRVNHALANQVNFDVAKLATETTELDRLFKIDLAAKLKNVDYIIDTLKSGDSFYIARALKKCDWLFEDEYCDIIHPSYLYENLFPCISMRMKRKVLKAAAKNVTNPGRAAQFYHCCMNEKMTNTACTCLLYTSEAFKIDILKSKEAPTELVNKDIVFLRFLVGKSFDILEAYLDYLSSKWIIDSRIRQFSNLYYEVSNQKYLDIAETYMSISNGFKTDQFDVKLSENIMKNHKDRVLAKPNFYICTLDTDILVKHSSIEDLNIYALAILPRTGREFWYQECYKIYRPIFEIIPETKRYEFLKNFFSEHYPDTEFEMHRQFWFQNYYKLLPTEERQEWAFRHLRSKKQILGVGNDFVWYRFIKFELAFPAIKHLISITTNATTRNDMVLVLIESAQNDRELEILFTYYLKRHQNELRSNRDRFLMKVIDHHNVFKFDELCWKAFTEILLTLDLYNTSDTTTKNKQGDTTYKTIWVLYNILNDEPFPEELMTYFYKEFNVDDINDHLENVGQENYQKLHDFFFNAYMEKVDEHKRQPHSEEVGSKVERYFSNIMSSMAKFQYVVHEDINHCENHRKTRNVNNALSDRQLLRDLKNNKMIVIQKIKDVKMKIQNSFSPFKCKNFLNKIKIYFPEDVTKIYLNFFENLINEKKDKQSVKAGVHGIFNLGDNEVKIDFMKKFTPVSAKIDRKSIDIDQLRTQKLICRYACISRPPLPLSSILMYVKGSYAKYSVHVFNTYLATLPLPMCLEFVHSLIDAPISIQKHAIRLAFQCFTPESLIKVVTNLWDTTKNVSMRSVIYKAIFDKVVSTKNETFMKVLLKFTKTLHQDDENELFDIVVSNKLSEEFLGLYIEDAWEAIKSFDDIEPNLKRKKNVIFCVKGKLYLLRKNFVLAIIEEHLNMMITKNKLEMTYAKSGISQIYKEKWQLLARYIMYYTRSGNSVEEYLGIIQRVVQNSIDKWDEVSDDKFFHQIFLEDLFRYLADASFDHNKDHFCEALPIFEAFLALVKSSLPIHDVYKLTWDLELAVISRKVAMNSKDSNEQDDSYDDMLETVKNFSQAVGILVLKCANNGTYAMTQSSFITEKVISHVRNILHVMYHDYDLDDEDNLDDILITLASGVVQFHIPETYMLAIKLLPANSEEEDFTYVIEKVQTCSNPEVKLEFFQKFRKYCDKSSPAYNTVMITNAYKQLCNIT